VYGTEHIVQGWHSGATVGVFSAAAGAAAGLKLPADKVVHALGIAGRSRAGLMAAHSAPWSSACTPAARRRAELYAALLAENEFTGITDVFESKYGGFCTTFRVRRIASI